MKKKMLALLLCMAMGVTMLSACGDEKTTDSDNSGSTEGRSLTVALVSDALSLDPHAKDSDNEMQVMAHLYDTLVEYDSGLGIKPGVAKSWGVAEDGVTWTFEIQEGVKFQNGDDLTADDVVFTFERIMEDPTLEMNVYLTRVDSIRAVDDHTVEMIAKYQYPLFVNSFRYIGILDRKTCEGKTTDEVSANPNGSGRYKLVDHIRESEIVLERNEEYWGEKPEVTNLTFRIISNAATRTAALLNGEVDFISKIAVMDVERVKAADNIEVMTIPNLSVSYLGFDHQNPQSPGTDSPSPVMDVKVRQAMAYAIDVDAIIDTVLNGYASPATSYIPASFVGYDTSSKRFEYDPEKAKALLAEAGYPNGFNIRIDANNESRVNEDQVAQAIAGYLEKIGITVEVNLLPRANFYDLTSAENLQSSFFIGGWGDSSGEGITIACDMIYTYDKNGQGGGNKGHYSNEKVDEILDGAMIEMDQQKRAELVMEADAIAREEVACIPLFVADDIFGMKKGIGYTPRIDGHIMAWDFTFDEAK